MRKSPLRKILDSAAKQARLRMKDLTVLSASRDPYRLDTPAGHAKGKWLADAYREVNPEGHKLHLRGLHYRLVGRVTLPNGQPYQNDDATWTWMSEQAAKCARYLGYLPWDALRDARNTPPQVFTPVYVEPCWALDTADVLVILPDELEPKLRIAGDLYRQPWRQVIIAEKQGVADALLPIAKARQASLVTPGGELSDQMLYDILSAAAADGRPLAIHQLGDFDPAGYQMAVSTARSAQAMRDSLFPELEVRVHAVALTLDQCQEWNLPSTPLKDTELRAVKWQAAMGREQTELDAAVALVPEAFAQVVDDSLSQYFDNGLKDRGEEESAELEYWANARLAEHLGDDALVNIRARAAARLDEISELVDQVNDALRFDPTEAGIDLPPAPIPIHGDTTDGAAPLFDSANDWTHATLRLIERKSYGQEVQA
jgi:hypothetical protein